MPPKKSPPLTHLMVKTHRYTLALTLTQQQSIRDLKQLVTRALSQFKDSDPVGEFNMSPSMGDFEIARWNAQKGGYDDLDESDTVYDLRLMAFSHLFLRWRDKKGKLLPVDVSRPSFLGEDDDDPMAPAMPAIAPAHLSSESNARRSRSKGKRKRVNDFDEEEDIDEEEEEEGGDEDYEPDDA